MPHWPPNNPGQITHNGYRFIVRRHGERARSQRLGKVALVGLTFKQVQFPEEQRG